MSRYSSAERVALESRRVERVYSVLARVYDNFFDWSLGPGRGLAVERLEMQPGARVLEVGVGTGLSLPLYPEDCRITGIDISEPMLERARARLDDLVRTGVDLQLMDARSLKYPDATFDHVLAPYVMSVVPEPEKVMSEVARVCRPAGTVIVVNQFLSDNAVLGALDRMFTPASRWLGFRMDLPLERVTRTPGLEVVNVERVNLFGLWRMVEMRRTR